MTSKRDAAVDASSGFAPDAQGARWMYAGALTYANAGRVYAATKALPLPTTGEIDLGGLGAIDSAAVAVLVALKRRSGDDGRPLVFSNVPAPLAALADLYGVEEILVT
jgi:phospholipid transport system transporter-binding protein